MNTEHSEEIREQLAVILGRQQGDLVEAIRILDGLKGQVTGHLAHYLKNRSYRKAWILLGGGDPEAGTCH